MPRERRRESDSHLKDTGTGMGREEPWQNSVR